MTYKISTSDIVDQNRNIVSANDVNAASMSGAVLADSTAFRNNTAGKVLTTNTVWDSATPGSGTNVSGNVTVSMSDTFNFKFILTGSINLDNPTNTKPGQTGIIQLVQNNASSYTVTFSGNWKFSGGTVPTISTTWGASDFISYFCVNSTFTIANLIKDVK